MTLKTSDSSNKLYQAQIESLKILKGVGKQNPEPCKKQNGFLSIEMANKLSYVIYRTLTGKALFNGIIGKQAKVKVLDATEDPKNAHKFKAKFTSLVSKIYEKKKS